MKGVLRFITCGSVDDGKSTLIGHMLYDARLIFADQKQSLELESKVGSAGGELDYSLLLDGLMAEREQGITIDVAYRYFATEARNFIVADTPGHEQYTRNMAVGASFADLAVILIDAAKGVSVQTRRHLRICCLMGIRSFVFAVNKMDLVSYDKNRFDRIGKELRTLLAEFDPVDSYLIPVSATIGDNVTEKSERMGWFDGPSLLSYLENVDVERPRETSSFLLPVQRVSRPNHTFRGYQGQIEAGKINVGDQVQVYPGRETALVRSILTAGKETEEAGKGQAVTLTLDREVDISRGCVLGLPEKENGENALKRGELFNTTLLWMDDACLTEGREYLLKLGTRIVPAVVMRIKYKIDVNSGTHLPSDQVFINELASCDIAASENIALTTFSDLRALGGFILIDRVSHMTSACGVVEHTLRRSENVVWQQLNLTREARAEKLGQTPAVIWFTGLSGSGKSTLADGLEKKLALEGKHTIILDGDNLRHGLNRDLGFKEEDRIENIRRTAEVAKLMNDAGLIVLVSLISPYREDRRRARRIIGDGFVEIYVDTPAEECERRDVKGLYAKARRGEIPNFTGVSSAYEEPVNADLVINTEGREIGECVEELRERLRGILERK